VAGDKRWSALRKQPARKGLCNGGCWRVKGFRCAHSKFENHHNHAAVARTKISDRKVTKSLGPRRMFWRRSADHPVGTAAKLLDEFRTTAYGAHGAQIAGLGNGRTLCCSDERLCVPGQPWRDGSHGITRAAEKTAEAWWCDASVPRRGEGPRRCLRRGAAGWFWVPTLCRVVGNPRSAEQRKNAAIRVRDTILAASGNQSLVTSDLESPWPFNGPEYQRLLSRSWFHSAVTIACPGTRILGMSGSQARRLRSPAEP